MRLFMSSGGSVLVHCAQGKSRSSVIAVSFLARRLKVSVREALDIVKTGRSMAQPNEGFWAKLQQMEREKLFA